MDSEFSEVLLTKLRTELRKANIQLWVDPYTDENGRQTGKLMELASEYSKRFNMPEGDIILHLEHLRSFALQKLEQNQQYKSQKLATIRLKYSPKTPTTTAPTFVQIKLDEPGSVLTSQLCDTMQLSKDQVKLIYNGRIVNASNTIASQGVRHNKTILCMILSTTGKEEAAAAEKQMKKVRDARRGAELLASTSRDSIGRYNRQITDQNGRTIDLPQEEKSALTIALSLHEMGRNVLKKKQYSNALLFLLEADAEFRQCSAQILNLVDNFAVLCLDISWCYLCLKNLETLQDAVDRLKTSEDFFKKSYGESLQRLLTIKGSSGHEVALFVRLYLLQGIVQYFNSNYRGAIDLLNKALSYANSIKVDDEQFTEMLGLGFSNVEARMALRACNGNVAAATQYVFKKREENEEIAKAEKEKSRKRDLARKLGKCANGNEINVDLYERMVLQFGFDKDLSSEALKQCNNDINSAIQMMNDSSELLAHAAEKEKKISKTLVSQVESVGFDPISAKAALVHFKSNLEQSIEYLSTHQGVVPYDWLANLHNHDEDAHSSKTDNLSAEDKKALTSMAKVVSKEENYLDISLDEELEYISQYLAMARSAME
uniref:NEDD8 ultimate buster 1-like n=1 Tax=Phallusia mammillata TaxID=59560 RepID=A0A6F9DM23_9ASCI|nr:NEDD8 ultimate buster 1-like [Phallusia mammillata]